MQEMRPERPVKRAVFPLYRVIRARLFRIRSAACGKRPYIQYKEAKYRNNILASSGEYVGKEITILIDLEDVSTVEAYNDKGYFLGTLTANGEYGRIPHSLKSRENAASLARENGMKNREFSTPLTEYETFLKGQAKTSRRAATKADILRKENKKQLYQNKINWQRKQKFGIWRRKKPRNVLLNQKKFLQTQRNFMQSISKNKRRVKKWLTMKKRLC